MASTLRTLEQGRQKLLQVKDKAGVARCAEEIAARTVEREQLLRRGTPLEEWCPFCAGSLSTQ